MRVRAACCWSELRRVAGAIDSRANPSMPYLLLILEPKGQRSQRSNAEGQAVYGRMLDYARTLKERGVLMAVESLREDGVRLNVEAGRKRVVDGPFAESKELIGGFFLVSCDTRDEALKLASECPAAEWATVEVRETGPCFL